MLFVLVVDWCCANFWCVFFFFKQKTAYEMRISDWSSDVCSSDLARQQPHIGIGEQTVDPRILARPYEGAVRGDRANARLAIERRQAVEPVLPRQRVDGARRAPRHRRASPARIAAQ